MNVLFKKLKRSNKFELYCYLIINILYITGIIFFIKSLTLLNGIETLIRIIIIIFFIMFGIIQFIWNLINIILKKHKSFIILTVFCILSIALFGTSSYFIGFFDNKIDNISEKEKVTYTTYLIALNDSVITDDSKLGMINDEDEIEWNILPKKLMKKESLNNEIENYDDVFVMLNDLYDGIIDGIFVSANYLSLYSGEEKYENIKDETYVVYSYSEKMENKDLSLMNNKKLTEPFAILLMGVDSPNEGLDANAAFNGDTLMLITFNPNTLTATVFSIPRDTYVPITCRKNAYAKINSSAAYGTSCVISTVEQLTDIKIDYYAKINFQGVIALVNALDGIDVEVTKSFCESNSYRSLAKSDLICLEAGYQHLTGEQTLAYARHRKTLLLSDIDRTKNQQLIVEAIAKKVLSVSSFSEAEEIFDAISNNISTNMNKKQILSFYDIFKKMLKRSLSGREFVKIKKSYMEYYDLPVYTSGMYTSAIGHYEGSLDAIKKAMKVNLGLEEAELIKTFNYSYSTPYEPKLVGQGITTGQRLVTVPSFIGQSVSYARDWASNNNITIAVNGNESGIIVDQNIHVGTLARAITNITVTTTNTISNIQNSETNNQNSTNEETSIDNVIESLIY